MSTAKAAGEPMPAVAAATIASSAFAVPLMLSLSSTPSPNHPRTMLWYLLLRKPGFKPPDWVFPVAWTAIEGALAVSGFRLLRAPATPRRSRALALWGWNVVMIGAWNRIFFKSHNLAVSTVAAAGLVATSVAFVTEARPVDRRAADAGVALAGWVTFATVLTATIWAMNSRRR